MSTSAQGTKTHYQEQLGDYILELPTPRGFWLVWHKDQEMDPMSAHNSKAEAKAAIRRYQAGDRRRRR